MLVVALGTVASASTWTFNVIRSLAATSDPQAVSFFAERGEELLANLPPAGTTVIVKAHWLDSALLRLLNLGGAKVIFTDRDPQDSAASQRERFGRTAAQTSVDICRTYVSYAMLRMPARVLALRYEDRFSFEPSTIRKFANFLEIELSETQAADIFAAHRSEAVKSRVDSWVKRQGLDEDQNVAREIRDTATQWHPRHVGDGLVGKGETRLSAEDRRLISAACAPWRGKQHWRDASFVWPAQLFRFRFEREICAVEQLEFNSEDRTVVWGPYCFLPPGRWRARPLVSCESGASLFFRLDAFVINSKRGVLATNMFSAACPRAEDACLEFDHFDHGEELEIRLHSVMGSAGVLLFRGVELSYRGPVDDEPPQRWRRVSDGLDA